MDKQATEKPHGSMLSLVIIIVIAVFAVASAVLSLLYPDFIFLISGSTYVTGGALFDAIYIILTLATYALYLTEALLVYGAGACHLPLIVQSKCPLQNHPLHSLPQQQPA
jgi:hypothetical protein